MVSEDTAALKSALREEARRSLTTLVLAGDEGDRAAALFLDRTNPPSDSKIALYWPIRRELDTLPLIEVLHAGGNEVLLPVIDEKEKTMAFHPWAPETPMTPGPFGIPQPRAETPPAIPDMIVAPLLAFDRRGNRLGQGAGYYDRAVADCRKENPRLLFIGYGYDQQLCLFPLPSEMHDIRLNRAVTPTTFYDFD